MNYKRWLLGMLVLWVVTIGIAGYFFVKGQTVPSHDARVAIGLAEAERDMILGEMRQFLKAVQGVLDSVVAQNLTRAGQAARAAGMGMAVDVNPALMAKLPLTFKTMGMSVHRDFDGLADGIQSGERAEQVLKRLSDLTKRCIVCHDAYRFSTMP